MQRHFTGERIIFSTNGARAVAIHRPKEKPQPKYRNLYKQVIYN